MKARVSLAFAIVVAVVFALTIFAATSGDVYQATSPEGMLHHTAVRKLWSILAFAVCGAAIAPFFRRERRVVGAMLAIAVFSAAIEIAQRFTGSHESFASNIIDIACGGVGGLVGGALFQRLTRTR